VAVVDDHPLIRKAIVDLVGETPGLVCCGEAATSASALALVTEHQPELATIDLTLGEESGLSLIQAITMASPRTRVLVLSMHDERLFAARCLKAGASGYLMKDQAPRELLVALCRLARGKTYVSEEAAEQILSAVGGRHDEGAAEASFEHLTDRERHVLTLLGHGLSTREIATRLDLSIKTVETHCGHLKEKLGLKSARELLRYAVIWGDEELPARLAAPSAPDTTEDSGAA
jgi:DNA-binding NarL/FixJ family response regulator